MCDGSVVTGKQLLGSKHVVVADSTPAEQAFDMAMIEEAERVEKEYNTSQDMMQMTEGLCSISAKSSLKVSNNTGRKDVNDSANTTTNSTAGQTTPATQHKAQHTVQTVAAQSNIRVNSSNAEIMSDSARHRTTLSNSVGHNTETKQAAATRNTSHAVGEQEKGTSTISQGSVQEEVEEDEEDFGSKNRKSKKRKREIIVNDEVKEEEEERGSPENRRRAQHTKLSGSEVETQKAETEARRLRNSNNPDMHVVREALEEMKSKCPFCHVETCTKYCEAACFAIYGKDLLDPVGHRRKAVKFWCNVCSLTTSEEKSGKFCATLNNVAGKEPLGKAC